MAATQRQSPKGPKYAVYMACGPCVCVAYNRGPGGFPQHSGWGAHFSSPLYLAYKTMGLALETKEYLLMGCDNVKKIQMKEPTL